MDRQETKAIMAILKAGYPAYYKNISGEEATNAVNLWAAMFAEEPAKVVMEAVKSLMKSLKYPPTIADVTEKIELLTKAPQLSEQEAWNIVKKAMNTSDFEASYNALPPEIRRLVGSVSQLKEWAYTEGDMSVIASNFMRSYRVTATRDKEISRLPESGKQLMKQLSGIGNLIGGSTDG